MKYTEDNNIDGFLMLIDFEKAFDSVYWKFMYNVLTFLGFPQNIVRDIVRTYKYRLWMQTRGLAFPKGSHILLSYKLLIDYC